MCRNRVKEVDPNIPDMSGEPIFRRLMRSGDVSKKSKGGRSKYSRHVWRASYSPNNEVRRCVEKE